MLSEDQGAETDLAGTAQVRFMVPTALGDEVPPVSQEYSLWT